MARVTVEDCIDKVENRFDLVLLASHRARMISSGSQITVERDNDNGCGYGERHEVAHAQEHTSDSRSNAPSCGAEVRRAGLTPLGV